MRESFQFSFYCFVVIVVSSEIAYFIRLRISMSGNPSPRVAVIGAGVIGLNTALELQRRHPELRVTVIADKFNGETLSDGAAGLFRPDTYVFGPSLQVSQQWVDDSFNFYKNLLNSQDEQQCGINEVSGYMFTSKEPNLTRNHYMENASPEFREATDDELKAHSSANQLEIKYGSYYTSLTIECKLFLPWALKKITNNGGTIVNRKLESFKELSGQYGIIFNCTGFGAKKLCNDLDVLPIRGQVIRVKAPWVDKFYYYDSDTYIIPSKDDGTVVLGGCRHFGSHDEQVNARNTEEILERCTKLIPSLREALNTSYEVWVGLRPYRNKIRVEAEHVDGTLIIHNYGHGGYGVTLAPGTVKYAVDMITPYL